MSTTDGPPQDPGGVDWESLAQSLKPSDIGQVLIDVLMQHNAVMEASGYLGKICNWDASNSRMPELRTPSHGNILAVEVDNETAPRTSEIPIGYFSAVTGEFEIKPELVNDEEQVEKIKAAATLERDDTIGKFNKTAGVKMQRLDYADPLVRKLHADYHEYLSSGIIDLSSILYNYNYDLGPETALKPHLGADEHTQATVFLRVDSITRRRVSEIGVRLMGAFKVVNGVQIRVPANSIVILERNRFSTSESGFEIKGSRIARYMVDELVEASNELIVADQSFGIEGRKFDTVQVGVYANPVRPKT